MASDLAWEKIYTESGMCEHDFSVAPFILTADEIKRICHGFEQTSEREPRLLCKQDTREARPQIFKDHNLFILSTRNGEYCILNGDGYVDIPEIQDEIEDYHSQLDFELESSSVGDSEMQHLDFAYANSLIRTFFDDPSLVLTIRGRKYTPQFTFKVNNSSVNVEGVQTEVDAGYEGRTQIVLIEAKNNEASNIIIRQLFYPFRQWSQNTTKEVKPVFFERRIINGEMIYHIWQFTFTDPSDYSSIRLEKAKRYRIIRNS